MTASDDGPSAKLSHIDAEGRARMVDVSDKEVTERVASAKGRVTMAAETLALINSGGVAKGNVVEVARLAGIMAAKRTAELIPLCHPLPVTGIQVDIVPDEAASCLNVSATVKTADRTGVEMEALTAVSVACLTIYDMAKAADRRMVIGDIRVVHKSGGKSGTFEAN